MSDDRQSPSAEDIASLLRVGLTDDELPEDSTATLFVPAPSASPGSSPSRLWQPPSVEDLQKMLPQYEVQAFVARGGMGAVYRGVQTTLKRTVAIKVLPPEADDAELQFA